MHKKLLCTVLAATMAFSVALTGCQKGEGGKGNADPVEESTNLNKTGLPIVKEKVTFTLSRSKNPAGAKKPFEELELFKDLEEKTNIHIKFDLTPSDSWAEKLSLMFASGDLPDGFYGAGVMSNDNILKYGTDKQLIPLEKLIADYAPNIKKLIDERPDIKKMLTAPDGHIYSLPKVDESSPLTNDSLVVNKLWLDKVGMKAPTTTEEFYQMLKVFKGKDLNGNGKDDEILFTFLQNNHINGVTSMFGSFGILDNNSKEKLNVKDNKVTYVPIQPEYKEAIKYFNRLFAEGLADKESLTQNASVYNAKVKRSDPGEYIVGAYTTWNTYGNVNENDFTIIPPLKGPNGQQMWNKRALSFSASGGAFAITSKCKDPEILMRWVDQNYEPEFAIQAYYGTYGTVIQKTAAGKIDRLPIPQGKTAAEFRHMESPGVDAIHFLTKDMLKNVVSDESAESKSKIDEMYKPYIVDVNYPTLFFQPEENQRVASLITDIDALVKEKSARWMAEGGIDSEWDAYVKKLKEMGLDEMIKIYQTAYDRYNSTK